MDMYLFSSLYAVSYSYVSYYLCPYACTAYGQYGFIGVFVLGGKILKVDSVYNRWRFKALYTWFSTLIPDILFYYEKRLLFMRDESTLTLLVKLFKNFSSNMFDEVI